MWVTPDTRRIRPSYEQRDIRDILARGGLVPMASGKGREAASTIRQRGAALWGGHLQPNKIVRVPDTKYAHVYVTRGRVQLESAAVLTAAGGRQLTADVEQGADALIWEMQ